MGSQRIEDPTRAELEWAAGYVALAAEMVAARHLGAGAGAPGVDELDALWAARLAAPQGVEDPNDLINAVGLAFGQRLVDDLGLRWVVVSDEFGTELATHAAPGDLLVFPANLVAKRWESRETGFLRPVYDGVAA